MPLRGWRPEGGSSRRYVNTRTGESISRHAYDNKRAQAAGWRNRYEFEQYRERLQDTNYSRWIYNVRKNTGRAPTMEDYRAVYEVRTRRARLNNLYPDLKGTDRDSQDA